jgi:putative transposase
MFELFDPQQDFAVRHGSLPHWFQPGVTYFVTFRTDDSVPQPLARSWHARRSQWLQQNGINPCADDWKDRLRDDPSLERAFHACFTRQFMATLDRGYGACLLGDRRVAGIVLSTLRHFDGKRYLLGDLIVIPNHVHLLVCLLGATEIESQCHSWKKFSAIQINRLVERCGRFWQEESFDHFVRSPDQFDYLRRYIAENPKKAGLKPGEFLHWVRPT